MSRAGAGGLAYPGPGGLGYPAADEPVTREMLARLDELNPCSEHWKILITAGMGFFADAYDLFIIGVAASLITAEWHIASYQKSLLSPLALLTSAAGAVVFGRPADKLGRKKVYGFEVLVLAAGAATAVLPFVLLCGATTFVYPAEIFPVRVRTTSHGIAAAAGKFGAFAGTYALTALLPVIGLTRTSAIVAGVCLLGLLVTVTLLSEPRGLSLEELTEPGSGRPARLLDPARPR
jgi:MFS family permease